MLLDSLKNTVRSFEVFDCIWGAVKREHLLKKYVERRERYARIAADRGLVYNESEVIEQVRQRLARRGYCPPPREPGQIHTFAFIPRIGWHSALFPDLEELGPLTIFDYTEHGCTWQDLRACDDRSARIRREYLKTAWNELIEAHSRQPVDWVFVYASGAEVSKDFIRRIVDELGVPVVNMCLDDKQSWTGPMLDTHRAGQIDIASAFDVSWTSARVACEWYLCEGGLPVYMPEGFDQRVYRPVDAKQDIPVSFIGGAYGFRPSVIRHLQNSGIPVQVFGGGWGTKSVWGEEQVGIINRSLINLGMGGIGYDEAFTNVKTRDFEIPGAGGGLYLTTFSPDLAQHYDIGREIICYQSREEIVELIRYHLARPDEARAIAACGRKRCLAEHRWLHRYEKICNILQIISNATTTSDASRGPRHECETVNAGAHAT